MTRARGSEEMGEKEVEKTSETSDSGGVSFEDLVCDWRGPDDLSDDLDDLVWDTVKDWLKDWQSAAVGGSKKTKVKNWKGALSNPIPFVKRSSEQFLFLL